MIHLGRKVVHCRGFCYNWNMLSSILYELFFVIAGIFFIALVFLLLARIQAVRMERGPDKPTDLKQVERKKQNLTKVLDFLITHERINSEAAASLLSIPLENARQYLAELQEAGYLRKGSSRGESYYVRSKDVHPGH